MLALYLLPWKGYGVANFGQLVPNVIADVWFTWITVRVIQTRLDAVAKRHAVRRSVLSALNWFLGVCERSRGRLTALEIQLLQEELDAWAIRDAKRRQKFDAEELRELDVLVRLRGEIFDLAMVHADAYAACSLAELEIDARIAAANYRANDAGRHFYRTMLPGFEVLRTDFERVLGWKRPEIDAVPELDAHVTRALTEAQVQTIDPAIAEHVRNYAAALEILAERRPAFIEKLRDCRQQLTKFRNTVWQNGSGMDD